MDNGYDITMNMMGIMGIMDIVGMVGMVGIVGTDCKRGKNAMVSKMKDKIVKRRTSKKIS